MAKEDKFGLMAPFMKEIGSQTNLRGKES